MYLTRGNGVRPARKRIRLPLEEYDWTNVFSVTIATFGRYDWFSRHPALADAVVVSLRKTSRERGSVLFAWCVMPDHVHLLLRDANLVGFVRLFKGRCTPIARGYEGHRRLWQRSFLDHGVRRSESLANVVRYVLNNPVEAGLTPHAADYKWSGSEAWVDWQQEDWSRAGRLTKQSVEESPCTQDIGTQDSAQRCSPTER